MHMVKVLLSDIERLNVYLWFLNKYKYNKNYGNFGFKCFGIMKENPTKKIKLKGT